MVKIIFIDDSVQQLQGIITLLKNKFDKQFDGGIQFEIIWVHDIEMDVNEKIKNLIEDFLKEKNNNKNECFLKEEVYEGVEKFDQEEFFGYLENKISKEVEKGNRVLIMLDLILNIDEDLKKLSENEEILSMKVYEKFENSCQLYSKYEDDEMIHENWNKVFMALKEGMASPRIIDRRDILPSTYRNKTLNEIYSKYFTN